MTAWRTIDSAPRDGTMILAGNTRTGTQAVVGWTPDDLQGGVWTDVGNRNAAVTIAINPRYFDCWQPLQPLPASVKP